MLAPGFEITPLSRENHLIFTPFLYGLFSLDFEPLCRESFRGNAARTSRPEGGERGLGYYYYY
jgi:hypothetical protein